MSSQPASDGISMNSDTTRSQLVDELRPMPLFEWLSDEQLRWLIGHSAEITIAAGQRLFSQRRPDRPAPRGGDSGSCVGAASTGRPPGEAGVARRAVGGDGTRAE